MNTEDIISNTKSLLRKKIHLPFPGFRSKNKESNPEVQKIVSERCPETLDPIKKSSTFPSEFQSFSVNDEEYIETLSSAHRETNYTFETEDSNSIRINNKSEITAPNCKNESEPDPENIPKNLHTKPATPNSSEKEYSDKDSAKKNAENPTHTIEPSSKSNLTNNKTDTSDGEHTSVENFADSELIFEEENPEQGYTGYTSEEIEEQSNDYDWDEYENLTEFDGDANQKPTHPKNVLDEEVFSNRLSKSERAKQIALDVITQHRWDEEALSLLQDIFIQNGWAACKSAIQRQIEAGLTLEELSLAHDIKNYWANSEIYWIHFRYQAHASHKNMTWITALKLTRAFNGFPDIYEITVFMDEAYDAWYSSPKLQNRFPGFFMFLENQCEKTIGAIQSNVYNTMKITDSDNQPEWVELGNGNYLRSSRPMYT